ncbi:MAG: hypothetical protein P4L51_15860, partial [Puia sp.]|nr:hypothetical protein [Puia sp.]
SNKLLNVIDGNNDATTTLGDFRTSANSPNYNNGGPKSADSADYNYDVNGNLTRDLNKDIGTSSNDGILYNHLNLPWQVTMQAAAGQGVSGVKGTITYIYDAAGNKLEKRVIDNSNASHTGIKDTTDYMGAFQYHNDTLQFFGHEEGRVRLKLDTINSVPATHFEYDYFLKDHLGNTRSVLTDEQETDPYPAATMETANAATEDLYYSQIDATRTALPAGYPTDNTTDPNAYVAKVSGAEGGNKIGPGITLKVMAGDQFNLKVSSWYSAGGTTPATPVASPLTDLVTALIAGVGSLSPGGMHLSPTDLAGVSSTVITPNVTDFLTDQSDGANTTKPLAYVNWVLFDDQMNYVASSSGFEQVGDDNVLTQTVKTSMPIDKNGYLYIYTSNETPNIDVFFDNLQVTVVRGPLTEENHYYPFGLTMYGISDRALKTNYAQNKYMYNKGTELQNKEFSDQSGLEIYQTEFRSYDPQLGRFL